MYKQYRRITNIYGILYILTFALLLIINITYISGDISFHNIIKYAYHSLGITTLIIIPYEKWLWKINVFDEMPRLKKVYKGTLYSSFDKKERDITVEIKQTLLSIHIIMTTDESRSASITASIDCVNGENTLIYYYQSIPNAKYVMNNTMHNGTAVLTIENNKSLKGFYYTKRQTYGDIKLIAQEK